MPDSPPVNCVTQCGFQFDNQLSLIHTTSLPRSRHRARPGSEHRGVLAVLAVLEARARASPGQRGAVLFHFVGHASFGVRVDDVFVDELVFDRRRSLGTARNGNFLVAVRPIVLGTGNTMRMHLEALHFGPLGVGVDLAAIDGVAIFDVGRILGDDADRDEVQAILARNPDVLPLVVVGDAERDVLVELAIRRLEHAIGGENFGEEDHVLGSKVGRIGQSAVTKGLALGDEFAEVHASALGITVRMAVNDGCGVDFPGFGIGFDKVCR